MAHISDYDKVLVSLGNGGNGDFLPPRNILEQVGSGFTAFAGGGQTNATQLTGQTIVIAVVATPGDSVALPPAIPGLEVTVFNPTANPMQVFGQGTDTVNGLAVATGVLQMQSSQAIYVCSIAGQWVSNDIGSGYCGSLPTVSAANALTAKPSGTQANSTLLTCSINRFTVVATAGDGALMMKAAPGLQITITNAAANAMNLFPASGDSINGAAVNTAYSLPAGKTIMLTSAGLGLWHGVVSA